VLPLRFRPAGELADTPHVVVDGAPGPATVLTLSHWPGTPTPLDVRDDLSVQIAFHSLARPELFADLEIVTNDHFDQDGLASLFVLTQPDEARDRRDLLIDVGAAGDFGTFRSHDAARISFAIDALTDPDRSPVDDVDAPYEVRCGALYEWALPVLPDLLDHPLRWRDLWAEEDARLTRSLRALEAGDVTIAEHPELDLAVVTTGEPSLPHDMAVNRATDMLRVATLHGRRYSLYCRYETWVILTSRLVVPRPDLRVLAEHLDALERDGARWVADPPSALVPRLHLADDGESSLTPEGFLAEVRRVLADAPPAWDPRQGT